MDTDWEKKAKKVDWILALKSAKAVFEIGLAHIENSEEKQEMAEELYRVQTKVMEDELINVWRMRNGKCPKFDFRICQSNKNDSDYKESVLGLLENFFYKPSPKPKKEDN